MVFKILFELTMQIGFGYRLCNKAQILIKIASPFFINIPIDLIKKNILNKKKFVEKTISDKLLPNMFFVCVVWLDF